MCHVLIIEDEPLIALDLEDLLQNVGAVSFSFADRQHDAIEVSRQIRPDIIVSDVSLAEGTGPLAVEAIRSEHGEIPVIFITATPEACSPYTDPDRVFRKPLDRRAISDAFRSIAFSA